MFFPKDIDQLLFQCGPHLVTSTILEDGNMKNIKNFDGNMTFFNKLVLINTKL